MGIRQLQHFMQRYVPNGYVEVSIIDECNSFKRNNPGKKPILVIDLMGVLAILNRDKLDFLYGGYHVKYFEIIDSLFKRLSDNAELVFFEDGPVVDQKYDTWLRRQAERYGKSIKIIDKIKEGVPIATIANIPKLDLPSIYSGLEIIETLAKKYGSVIVTVTKECDAELAQFASRNPSVIAVLAEDSDFLIFPGKWKYFSIDQIGLTTLTTMEFSRTALRNYLDLRDGVELKLFATIAGNDVIPIDMVRFRHHKDFGGAKADEKFPAIAEFILDLDMSDFELMIFHLTKYILHDNSQENMDRIKNSICQYHINFEIPNEQASPLLAFCRENSYNFVYSALQTMPDNFSLGYFDLRNSDWPDLNAAIQKQDSRQYGIILQHKAERIIFDAYIKKSHDQPHQKYSLEPVYPEIIVPPLLELLNRDAHPQHDPIRFELLKWSISDSLKGFDLLDVPGCYLKHVLTLYLLVSERFISVIEADVILLSIKHVLLDMIPEDFQYPPIIDPRAFEMAFLYTDMFNSIQRALEIVGLRHLNILQNFDGAFFHKLYLDFKDNAELPSRSLKDIDNCRIYKSL